MSTSSRAVGLLEVLSGTTSYAAEMAFYFALSLVPFLGLTAVAAVSWLPAGLGDPLASTLIRVFAPEAGLDAAAITAWVRSIHSSGWVAAGVALAAYSAFRFMAACVRALASLAGVEPRGLRHRVQSAASAMFLVVVWMVALLLLSFVVLVAPPLRETLEETVLSRAALTASALSRGMAALVLLAAIALTYRAIPRLQARGWRLVAMAALATCGWLAAGWTVTRLLPSLWRAEALYGALASFVVFLLWSYANALVLLVFGRLAGRPSAE
jgi:uncharacterized BrkB/YihY/UPF0761 family membrane protein